jgi:serine/threonine protein kinase
MRIGAYLHCQYVASGVTAEVYRSKDRALKVIVETRNIEPHNPTREAKILELLQSPCIPLLETFRDQEQRFVLVFPFMPLTLANLLEQGSVETKLVRHIIRDVLMALAHIHSQGIIHRDIKPSAILLSSATGHGPVYLSDFGTAWHPSLSSATEPPSEKILDIGTGPYRAPEALFGNHSYGPAVDMWAIGTIIAECCRRPSPRPLFESRAAHEDGNQLGLILSIFKTIGSPTPETWPEALTFRTPPFDMYRVFEQRSWEDVLPDVPADWRELVAALVKYDSSRATAEQVSIYLAMYRLRTRFLCQRRLILCLQVLRFPCMLDNACS